VEKQSNTIIGNCGFHTWNPQHHRAEIGYAMNSDEFKNKGFMKETLEKIIEFGFQDMDLNRIEALISENNIPSRKLLDYFGFTKEGVMRGHYLVGEVFEDSVSYSLLKSEYKK
jgi:[ribosomal protein S5]-alanine N-acetyltransferase